MKVPANYVLSKCCGTYQNPLNEICVRCGEKFFQKEDEKQTLEISKFPIVTARVCEHGFKLGCPNGCL